MYTQTPRHGYKFGTKDRKKILNFGGEHSYKTNTWENQKKIELQYEKRTSEAVKWARWLEGVITGFCDKGDEFYRLLLTDSIQLLCTVLKMLHDISTHLLYAYFVQYVVQYSTLGFGDRISCCSGRGHRSCPRNAAY